MMTTEQEKHLMLHFPGVFFVKHFSETDMERSPSIGETIRELISYSAIAVVASFLCGTIWYIRIKFRHLMANQQILPQTLRGMRRSYQSSTTTRFSQADSTRSFSLRPESSITVQEPGVVNLPVGYHEHPLSIYKDDLPPSYTSLSFSSLDVKDSTTITIENIDMEHPPSYRSIFFVSPPTPVDIT